MIDAPQSTRLILPPTSSIHGPVRVDKAEDFESDFTNLLVLAILNRYGFDFVNRMLKGGFGALGDEEKGHKST